MVAVPEANASHTGTVKAAAALANHLAPHVVAHAPQVPASTGNVKSDAALANQLSTHAPSEHAGSVKGAAAIVNQGSAGKYFGTSGHSGTHTSGYVPIPEAQTQGTVKFAASHLNMLTQA